VLVPQRYSRYFQVQLVRGSDVLDVRAVKTLEDAYPIARRWQLESRVPLGPTSTALSA
jgi:hypothetical protein